MILHRLSNDEPMFINPAFVVSAQRAHGSGYFIYLVGLGGANTSDQLLVRETVEEIEALARAYRPAKCYLFACDGRGD